MFSYIILTIWRRIIGNEQDKKTSKLAAWVLIKNKTLYDMYYNIFTSKYITIVNWQKKV